MKPYNILASNTRVTRGQPSTAFCQASGWPVPCIIIEVEQAVRVGDFTSAVESFTKMVSVHLDTVTENTTITCKAQSVEGTGSNTSAGIIYCKYFFNLLASYIK